MQVLPQCGHAVHEDAPEKVRIVYLNLLCMMYVLFNCLKYYMMHLDMPDLMQE